MSASLLSRTFFQRSLARGAEVPAAGAAARRVEKLRDVLTGGDDGGDDAGFSTRISISPRDDSPLSPLWNLRKSSPTAFAPPFIPLPTREAMRSSSLSLSMPVFL